MATWLPFFCNNLLFPINWNSLFRAESQDTQKMVQFSIPKRDAVHYCDTADPEGGRIFVVKGRLIDWVAYSSANKA